jgi:hypothetical protein
LIARAAAALAAAALTGCAVMPEELPPPPPCGVTVDGRLDVSEWQNAQRIELRDGAVLWMIQGPQHLCIAAETRELGPREVDIFVTDGAGVRRNLRAAAQVGERTLSGQRWSDDEPAMAWGQTTGWTANAAPAAGATSEGYEFVIDRARMPRPWRMRVELRDAEGDARDIVWPAQSRRTDVLSWALLQ